MTNVNPHPDRFNQEVDFESRYFDNLRHLAERELAGPGAEFTVEVKLIPATGYFHRDRSILIREEANTLGELPESQVDTWWPLVCALADAGETLSIAARVWTSSDWDDRFYASVWIALPTLGQALQTLENDAVDLTRENLKAYQSFAHEVTDQAVPAWRAVHGMTDLQNQSDVNQNPQQFNDSSHNRATALYEYQKAKKNPVIAWVLWVLLGDFGGHRYYLGDYPQGALMTGAGLLAWVPGMLWALIDAFNLNRRLREVNYALWSGIATKHGVALEPLPEGT